MIFLQSALENVEETFVHMNDQLSKFDFTIGGNWDYEQGSFDRQLDEDRKVWLRIPFTVTRGSFDGESENSDAVIQIGNPYVLRHLYNEGLDHSARMDVAGALFDQFQEPVDQDAEIDHKWVEQAEAILRQIEQKYMH